MNKKYCLARIEEIKKSIEDATDNKNRATDHIEEGELLMKAFEQKVDTFK